MHNNVHYNKKGNAMTTEDTTPTIVITDDGATVSEGAVRGEDNLNTCYMEPVAGEDAVLMICDDTDFRPIYEADGTIVTTTTTVEATVGHPPVPTPMTLPETGAEPTMLGIGAILLIMGMGLRKLAHR